MRKKRFGFVQHCRGLLPAVLAAVLAACAVPGSVQSASSALALPVQSQGPSAPAALRELSGAGQDYEEIRSIARIDYEPARAETGFFTMRQNEKWGLMRSDGTVLLPCRADRPVYECQMDRHWHWMATDLKEGEWQAFCDALESQAGGTLCDGHGGQSKGFYLDPQTGTAKYYDAGEVGIVTRKITAGNTAQFGGVLPCQVRSLIKGGGDPDTLGESAGWALCGADGAPLTEQVYGCTNWFFGEPLAPAEQNGKWAYLGQDGTPATDFCYSAVYATADTNAADAVPTLAAPLQNGFAAVCRDGRYGLLGADGSEVVSCEYAGAAWDGSTLWLKTQAGWRSYALTAERALPAGVAWQLAPTLEADTLEPMRYGCTQPFAADAQQMDYNTAYDLVTADGLSLVGRGGYYGLIDHSGVLLADCRYQSIFCGAGGQYSLAGSTQTDTLGPGGTPQEKQPAGADTEKTLCWVEEKGRLYRWGGAENTLEQAPFAGNSGPTPAAWIQTWPQSTEQYAGGSPRMVLTDGQKPVGDTIYDAAGAFSSGVAPVKLGGRWGYADLAGELVLPIAYDACWYAGNTAACYSATENTVVLCRSGEFALYGTDGREILPFGLLEALRPVWHGTLWAKQNGRWGLLKLSA